MSFIRKFKRNGRIYLAEVKNERDGGKVKQTVIRYLGLEPGQEKSIFPKKLSELEIDGSRVYGSVIVLDFIAKQLGLYELLGEQAQPILALVYCHCHDYRSVAKVERWFRKTDLSKIFGVAEIPENRLRDAIISIGKMNLLDIQKSIFEMLMKLSKERHSSILYDVTNTYFTGTCSTLGRQGRDKDGVRGRRLIQIGLAITKKYGFPIFHQLHPGNIHDAKIFGEAISYLKYMDIRKGTIVYDRGITAKTTISELSSRKWKVIAGMPMHRGIKNIISKMDLFELENYRNRIEQGISTFYVITTDYAFGSTKGKLAILLNPRKKVAKREERIQKIVEAQKHFTRGELVEPALKMYLTKTGKINTHAIKRDEHFDGISCIFTNGKFTREEIVKIYFGRDLIEKSFQSLKGVLSLRPIRAWLEENVEAHLFICYLAYTLQTTFRFLLQKHQEKHPENEQLGISAEEALEELTDVYRMYFHRKTPGSDENTQLNKLVTLTKRQEAVLRAISPKLLL